MRCREDMPERKRVAHAHTCARAPWLRRGAGLAMEQVMHAAMERGKERVMNASPAWRGMSVGVIEGSAFARASTRASRHEHLHGQ